MMQKAHIMKEETEFHVEVIDVVDQMLMVFHQVEDGVKDQMNVKLLAGVLIRK